MGDLCSGWQWEGLGGLRDWKVPLQWQKQSASPRSEKPPQRWQLLHLEQGAVLYLITALQRDSGSHMHSKFLMGSVLWPAAKPWASRDIPASLMLGASPREPAPMNRVTQGAGQWH